MSAPVLLGSVSGSRPRGAAAHPAFADVRAGVVDLGGNTARLLVADLGPEGLERVVQERVVLGLGAEIERHGRISKQKLAAAAATVERLQARAWEEGCGDVEVLVTSPGRQSANRAALERALSRGAPKRIRFVTSDEEARLAYAGAVASAALDGGAVAVCDLGGGSTEIAVGWPRAAPVWCTSLDVGSLRITERYLHHDPPTRRQIEKARAAVRVELSALSPGPPAPARALATGGTARALRKLVGETLGPDQLAAAVEISTRTSPRKLARRFGVPRWRARVIPGGALVLLEIQALLGVPLEVAAGGLREGAVLRLLERAALAA